MTDPMDFDLLPNACRFGCSPAPMDHVTSPPEPARTSAAAGPIAVAGAIPPRQAPEILMRPDPAWRRDCLSQTAHIPSGYTYLAQLMGHDMGSSVSLSSVPHVRRGNAIGAVSVLGPMRYNLIDNPLTLETVYGPGPLMLSHVYDPDTMLFRLTPGARLARVYRMTADTSGNADRQPIRALYDERNRDLLMLHELTVAWMQFHNLCARQLLDQGVSPFAAYVMVRSHAVRVWHGIVRNDILPRFLHPAISGLSQTPAEWQLDEGTLLHGLFRAFHAMPLAAYDLGRSGIHNLRTLLKTGFDHTEAETDWAIDWPLFFGEKPGGPKSGLSASVAPELRAPGTAAAVIAMDHEAAGQALPLRPGNVAIEAALAKLPAPWPGRLAPTELADAFNTRFPDAPVEISASTIEWGPLFQMLMIEAQLYGQNGGLGPFGSALLCGSITGSIDRVVLAPPQPAASNLPRPETMLKLIAHVRRG